ncbi:MAG: hypothetical protein R2912_11755 [Eubacteriales bacterium]
MLDAFSGEDEISDNASPELSRIRRQIKIVGERVREKLNKYAQEPDNAEISARDGHHDSKRDVMCCPLAEHRAQVPGLVHDQSSSGATLFIEPSAVVELGNENKRLFIEEKNGN